MLLEKLTCADNYNNDRFRITGTYENCVAVVKGFEGSQVLVVTAWRARDRLLYQ